MGTELFNSLDKEHDIVDRDWRPFVEECDLIQGIQVFATFDDAWGGFASSYLEALRDEYPKTCIWLWGLQNPITQAGRQKRQLRLANTAQTLHQACAQASMVVPIALQEGSLTPNAKINYVSPWHVSTLVSAATETALLPSRIRHSLTQASLGDTARILNATGSQTLALAGLKLFPEATEHGKKDDDEVIWFPIAQEHRTRQQRNRIHAQVTSYRGPSTGESDQQRATTDELNRGLANRPTTIKYRTLLPLLPQHQLLFYPAKPI